MKNESNRLKNAWFSVLAVLIMAAGLGFKLWQRDVVEEAQNPQIHRVEFAPEEEEKLQQFIKDSREQPKITSVEELLDLAGEKKPSDELNKKEDQ